MTRRPVALLPPSGPASAVPPAGPRPAAAPRTRRAPTSTGPEAVAFSSRRPIANRPSTSRASRSVSVTAASVISSRDRTARAVSSLKANSAASAWSSSTRCRAAASRARSSSGKDTMAPHLATVGARRHRPHINQRLPSSAAPRKDPHPTRIGRAPPQPTIPTTQRAGLQPVCDDVADAQRRRDRGVITASGTATANQQTWPRPSRSGPRQLSALVNDEAVDGARNQRDRRSGGSLIELTVDVTGYPVPASQSEVRRAMARGGAHVALQAADEMRHYWELAFAPHREAAARALSTRRSTDARACWSATEPPHSSTPRTRHSMGRHPTPARREPLQDRAARPLVIVVPSLVAPRPGVAVDPKTRRKQMSLSPPQSHTRVNFQVTGFGAACASGSAGQPRWFADSSSRSTSSAAMALMVSSPSRPHGCGSWSTTQMVPSTTPVLSISGAPR